MRILIATEGAEYSDVAVRLGTQIARDTDADVTLLTVIAEEKEQEDADILLNRAANLGEAPGEQVTRLVRVGQPTEEIVREASAGEYDLLVVGERPLHRLWKRLTTHTAERVIAHMPCSILVARNHRGPLRRFLIVEGGKDPQMLGTLIGRLEPLLQTASAVEVLHVMSQMAAAPGVPGWELRAEASELMEKQTPEGELLEHDQDVLEEFDVDAEVKVRHGVVVDEILTEARKGEFDLIIIAAHESSGWQRFLSEDPVHEIILRGHGPVLVV